MGAFGRKPAVHLRVVASLRWGDPAFAIDTPCNGGCGGNVLNSVIHGLFDFSTLTGTAIAIDQGGYIGSAAANLALRPLPAAVREAFTWRAPSPGTYHGKEHP